MTRYTADRVAAILDVVNDDQKRALAIPCPSCDAGVGELCHPAAQPDRPIVGHLQRIEAARPFGGTRNDLTRARDIYLSALQHPRLSAQRRTWYERMIVLITVALRLDSVHLQEE